MKRSILAGLTALGMALPPTIAAAATAFTVGPTNVRTGPGPQYPIVAKVAGGFRVEVAGCVKGYEWCRIPLRGHDAWINSSRLEIVHQGRRVVLGPNYYRAWGAPVIVFNF
jgi:uncharacterized protein YraI